MQLFCQIGLHFPHIRGTENGTEKHANEFRVYKTCDCGKKRTYDYNGQYVSDNDLLGYGTK